MVMLVEGKYHVPFWQAIRWNWPRSEWKPLALGRQCCSCSTCWRMCLPMPKDTPFEHLFDRPRDAYLLAIIAVTLGPLMEELFFRGFLYPVLARRMGVVWGDLAYGTAVRADSPAAIRLGLGRGSGDLSVGVVCGVVRAATQSVAQLSGARGIQRNADVDCRSGDPWFRHMEKAANSFPFERCGSTLFRIWEWPPAKPRRP